MAQLDQALHPQFGYARSGDVNIAYQVVGDGPIDLVFVMGWVSHLDALWEAPRVARFFRRLASFSRLILFDKRGTGLSDPVSIDSLPTLEQRMDDVRAVMDAVGSERAALFGVSEGGPMCALFAATYPERCASLVMYGGYARRIWSPDYPWAPTPEERQRFFDHIQIGWGGIVDLLTLAPSTAGDGEFQSWWASYLRRGASPGAALALAQMNTEIDIRNVLPTIHVPTLVIHRADDLDADVGNGRYLAEHVPDAQYVELPGNDHLPFAGDQEDILGEIEQFLTGIRRDQVDEIDRVLATVMIVRIVDAGETAARLGDERWSDLRDRHVRAARELGGRYRASHFTRTLDGLMATFDGPARAVRCARELIEGDRALGLSTRVGLHTGEVVESGNDVVGVAVHLADRIAERASPGSILVSNTVKDLVAGSGLEFEPIGQQVFPGLPGEWRLFTVADGDARTRQPQSAVSISATSRLAILSPREREVTERLALGLSNRQIADELYISPATVERHVANILVKLGFHSRTQIAAWAVEQGILRTPLEPS